MSKSNDEGAGCAILLGITALAIGAGCLWGAGVGWILFGVIVLYIAVMS